MRPKWNYPAFADNTSYAVNTFYRQKEETDDVVFAGTSHIIFGVSPMEMYKNSGIVSFNIGTSLQGMAETYVLTKKRLADTKA